MPNKKTTQTAPAKKEVKAEVAAKAVKETVAEPAKKAAAPVAKKPVEKKPVAKKPVAKKPATKKTSSAAPKETVKIQFGDAEFDFAQIKKNVEADCKAKVKGTVKSIEIYIKPEDGAVYYVANSEVFDKIDL